MIVFLMLCNFALVVMVIINTRDTNKMVGLVSDLVSLVERMADEPDPPEPEDATIPERCRRPRVVGERAW